MFGANRESAARIFVADVNLSLLDAMKTLRSLSITLSMALVRLATRLLVTPEVSAAIQTISLNSWTAYVKESLYFKRGVL
jgi:hypothetical protein